MSRGPYKPSQDPVLAWAQELPKIVKGSRTQLKVYGKPAHDNRGGICSGYLKHIVENYDNLADFTFFIQDSEWSWTHTGPMKERLAEAIASKRRYFNINDTALLKSVYTSPYVHQLEEWYTDHIHRWIPFSAIPNPDWATGFRGGNQFLVHKTLIQELPREFYEQMYSWALSGQHTPAVVDAMLETTWHLFFVTWPRMEAKRRQRDKIVAATGGMGVPSAMPPIA